MNHTPPKEYLAIEMKNLREELRGLKQCQILFIGLAFSTTGAILGLVKLPLVEGSAFIFLAPLVVIFPTFFFFFDKAKTITRIVGYYRLLESISLGEVTPKIFPGWENALEIFRKVETGFKAEAIAQRKKPLPKLPSVAGRVFLLKPPYVYWSLAYVTFAVIALLCPMIALWASSGWVELIAAVVLLVAVLQMSYRKLNAVLSLSEGSDSYGVNCEVWKKIIIEARQEATEQVAPPNAGPATPSANSGLTERPPSVS